MRNLLTALVLLASGWGSAQNTIVGYEHWLDENDADGDRTYVQANGETIDLSGINVPVGQLGIGLHRVHFRLRDDNDAWSSVLRRSFYIASGASVALTSGEYWFDQDDEIRTAFEFADGQNIDITIDPGVSGLELGIHRVHFRIRDDQEQWSAVLTRTLHIESGDLVKLTLLRYWSDDSQGYPDDMTTMAVDPEVEVWDVVDEIMFCNWQQTGETDVYFQIKDNKGQWSSVITDSFNIDPVSTGPDAPTSISGESAPETNSSYDYTAEGAIGAGAYEWILPVGWTGSSSTATITVQTGDITVGPDSLGVIAINGCGISDTLWYQITTGMTASGSSGNTQLFPNPTSGQVTLTLESNAPITRLTIHNATGQLVKDLRPAQSDRLTLDLSDEANGLYTVRIAQSSQHTKLQVMVQH